MKAILLFGGSSDERLVSVASGQNLARQFSFDEIWFLHPQGPLSKVTTEELARHERPFEVEFKPAQKPFAASLAESFIAVAGRPLFLALHGTEGEDGGLQTLFEKNGVHFTGSGAKSSADCFNKISAKNLARQNNFPPGPRTNSQGIRKTKMAAADKRVF